jgi:hypothetical protein
MALWLPYLIVVAALVWLRPLVAWTARRFGGKARGGLMRASALLAS